MKRKIIFDMDDILWGLNEKVCNDLGIDIHKIVDFSIKNNNLLTTEEQNAMIETYYKAETFRDIKFYKGVSKLMNLANLFHLDISICSNCMSKEVADEKIQQLKAEIKGIKDENIKMHVIEIGEHTQKVLPDNLWIFTDDSPYNIAKSNAELNLMVTHPWNESERGKILLQDKNHMIFKSFEAIYAYIYAEAARRKMADELGTNAIISDQKAFKQYCEEMRKEFYG